jgi:hypothetical protein
MTVDVYMTIGGRVWILCVPAGKDPKLAVDDDFVLDINGFAIQHENIDITTQAPYIGFNAQETINAINARGYALHAVKLHANIIDKGPPA